jgi:hypothetical protein
MLVGFSQEKKAEIVKTLDVWISPTVRLFLKDGNGWRAPNGLRFEVVPVCWELMNGDVIYFDVNTTLYRFGDHMVGKFPQIKEALIALADLNIFKAVAVPQGMIMYPTVIPTGSSGASAHQMGFLETEKPVISYDTQIFLSGRVFDYIATQRGGGFACSWKASNGLVIAIGVSWSGAHDVIVIPPSAHDKVIHLEKEAPTMVSYYDRLTVALVELADATRAWDRTLVEKPEMTFY